jgi:hypothetical protein
MSSSELIKNINSVENYIKNCGIDYEIVGAYSTVVKMAAQEKDENLLKITHRAKTILEKFVYDTMGGITMWDIEKKFFAQGVKVEILEKWYDILLIEAQNKHVDSYFRYLERKRVPNERFYEPRRKQLVEIGIVSALQGMIDDEYDILCVSLPPGTGKAQPLYSKVLTPNGFVNMGDIKVGSKVISGTGKVCKVLGVYPQGKKPIYELTLDDGSKCRCSDEHLWTVQNRCDRAYETRTGIHRTRTIQLKDMLDNVRICSDKRVNYSLDYVEPIQFKEKIDSQREIRCPKQSITISSNLLFQLWQHGIPPRSTRHHWHTHSPRLTIVFNCLCWNRKFNSHICRRKRLRLKLLLIIYIHLRHHFVSTL